MLGSAVNDSLYTLYVGLPSSVGTMMRVRYLDTESYTLSANITFCHGVAPPFTFTNHFTILSYIFDKCKSFLKKNKKLRK